MRIIARVNEGEETILTDCVANEEYCLLVGDAKIDGKYGILLAKMSKDGKILWKRIYGDEDEYEAQAILKVQEGYIIAGNAHGHATEEGGEGWQAYLLLVDEEGKVVKERSYKIGKNAAIYHVIKKENLLYCLGESLENGKRFVFRAKFNQELKIKDVEKYESCEDVLTGGMSENCIAYSCKKGRWKGKVKCRGWERVAEDFIIYDLKEGEDFILIAGSRGDKGYLVKMSKEGKITSERSLGPGAVTSVEISDGIIAAGEEDGCPAVYVLDSALRIIEKHTLKIEGWFEKVSALDKRTILLGYFSNAKEAIIVEEKTKEH